MATRKSWALASALVWGLVGCAPVEILKEMPANGTIRSGSIVYVDDGKCTAGEVKRIVGGNQGTGAPRQMDCVKKPDTR